MTISGILRNALTVLLLAGVLVACDVYTYNDALRDWNKSHEPPPPLDPPEMISPVPGSTLAGSTQTFTWTGNGASVDEWQLLIGSSPAGSDLFSSGALVGNVLTIDAAGLPTDGSPVHVRLGWTIAGATGQADYVYTAYLDNSMPAMVSPVPGSTLAGNTQTFTWTGNGATVDEWQLLIGRSPAANDLFNSGALAGGVLTLDTNGLPTDGSLVYVRLSWIIAGATGQADYVYTATDAINPPPPPPLGTPYLASPVVCSVLDGSTNTFSWSANGAVVDDWRLQIGTLPKGKDLFDSGLLAADVLSTDATGLPTDGSLVYVRLRWTIAGQAGSADYIFKSMGQGAPPPPPGTTPAMVSPEPCSRLAAGTQTFTWSANGAAVEEWRLLIGSSPKGRDLFNSGPLTGDVLSLDVTGLPADGSFVYVRLRWTIGGQNRRVDYIYLASNEGGPPPPPPPDPPEMVSPVPGSVLAGSTETFTWTANGATAEEWRLLIGTSPAGNDLFNSGALAGDVMSLDVPNLPIDGSNVYVRLRWTIGGQIRRTDYMYIAADLGGPPPPPPPLAPAIVSPVPGSVLAGSMETFSWSAGTATVNDWRLLIGSSSGANDLFDSGALTADVLSMDVTGLPTDGSAVFVRLRWTVGTTIKRANYDYTAALVPPPATVFGSNLSEIQSNVFAPGCANSGCHTGTNAAAGLNLDDANSYAELVGIPSTQDRAILRIAAGDPDNSYLVQKLEGSAATGAQMPSGGALAQSDIDVIRQWILDGAMDDRAQASGPIRVSSLSPMPDAVLDSAPVQLVVGFDRDLDASAVNFNTFILEASGGDASFGDGNETQITAASIFVPLTNPRSAVFDLTGVALGDDTYRVRLLGAGASLIMDLGANALDGEFTGVLPSGDGAQGGDFSAQFIIAIP